MHTEQSLFCRSFRRHIGTVHGDQGDTVTRIELMAQRLTDIATVAEEDRSEGQGAGQVLDRRGVMRAGWAEDKASWDARTITNEMEFLPEKAFVFSMALPIILRTKHFRTALRATTPADRNRHTVNNKNGRCTVHIRQ